MPDRPTDAVDPSTEWPEAVTVSARTAAERGLPGWPRPGEVPPGPPVPVPPGRGGEQRIPRPYNARAGDPAPWATLPAARRRPALADVARALAALGPARPSEREISDRSARPSAVLAPLYDEDGEAHVVLTRRTWGLRTHQGEVSFPGGRVEPGEAPVDGALREAKEEIDLDPSTVEVIGELDHLATVSSWSFIVPYVGALPGRPETHPNPAEVEAVLHHHPQVMDAAVFGIPDDEWGESVYAIVQARPGETLDLDDVNAFVSERLAAYKRPRAYEVRDELPRTESGKLLKRLLRDEFWQDREQKV